MKNFTKLFSFMMLVGLLFNSCRNPAYEINVLFDADVIKYKATVIVKGANGETLPALTVTATGTDAASIYDFSGTKAIGSPAGIITVGVEPKSVPTASKKISFNLSITASGYEPKLIPVEMVVNQFSQIVNVTLLKTIAPSPVSTVLIKEVPLSSTGATTAITSFSTPTSSTVKQVTSITIPAGVQFKDAAGNVLVGNSLTVQVINFNADDPAAIGTFPGGKLSAPNVVDANGNTSSAFFLPAAYADVRMFVNGTEVKSFSSPISISMELNPDFVPQATGVKVKAGDPLSVYSYQTTTGQFKYETVSNTVLDAATKPATNFQTNHLTVFIVGDVIKTAGCVSPIATISAPWLLNGAQRVVTFETVGNDGSVLSSYPIVIGSGASITLQGLPPVAVNYVIRDYVAPFAVLGGGKIDNSCAGAALTISVNSPGTPLDFVSLLLNVNCAGKGTIVVPNFDLFFKPAGAPDSQYVLLGTAVKGAFKTTNLKIGSSYDFKANWGGQIKVVNNRPITAADMSTVVGENDFLGSKSPAYNRMLLIEACKTQ
ncbi:hypothetical protein ACVWYN_000018 [Pedobacter sp. UYP24]